MAKNFRERQQERTMKHENTETQPYEDFEEQSRDTDKPWESIIGGDRGRQKYSREWNSGYDGSGKGTW